MPPGGTWRAVSTSLANRSEKWKAIDDAERVLWLQILLRGDNFGTLDGDATGVWVACTRQLGWTLAKTQGALLRLEEIGLVQTWVCEDGIDWVHVVDFDDHQPGEYLRKRAKEARAVPPIRPNAGQAPAQGPPQNVERRTKNVEQKSDTSTDPSTPQLTGPTTTTKLADRQAVFDHWMTAFKKIASTVLDDKRARRIDWAVKTYSVEQAKLSIDGYAADDWEGRKKNHDLTLLFRDAAHVERGLELASRRRRPPGSSLVRPAARAVEVVQ